MTKADDAVHTEMDDTSAAAISVEYHVRVTVKNGRISAEIDGIEPTEQGMRRCLNVLAIMLEDLAEQAERERVEQGYFASKKR